MTHKRPLIVLEEKELHDSLEQMLIYINMQIENIRKMLKYNNPQTIDNSLVALSKVIEETNTDVGEFIYGVRKALIFKDGFFETLRQYLLHFEQSYNINIKIHNHDNITDEQIGLTIGVQLLKIIQEALSNIRKHAQADNVTITFNKKDNDIIVSISDNSIGYNPENKKTPSFEMSIVKEHTNDIGGQIKVTSTPSHGTTVTIVFTYSSVSKDDSTSENKNIENDIQKIKVLLADDHVLFMNGLQNLIEQHNFKVIGTAKDGYEALEKARMLKPDMVLMNLQMPRCNGIIATHLIKMEMPDIKIVILTTSDREQDFFKAIKNGACGYLHKSLSTEDFIEQLYFIASNKTLLSQEIASQVIEKFELSDNGNFEASFNNCLSKRQIEILSLVAKGCTYKEVAANLYISERTVKYEMSNILKLLQFQNRSEAISYARKVGLAK